jgi:uridine kinase
MVIGIGGLSRSGKSTLAQQLATQFREAGASVRVLDQDDFVVAEEALPRIRDRADWDHPASMDFKGLLNGIQEARHRYEVVIVEGILVFYDPEVDALFDRRLFINLDKKRFLERRRSETRWGVEPEWYLEHVWEAHWRYGRTILEKENAVVEIREPD